MVSALQVSITGDTQADTTAQPCVALQHLQHTTCGVCLPPPSPLSPPCLGASESPACYTQRFPRLAPHPAQVHATKAPLSQQLSPYNACLYMLNSQSTPQTVEHMRPPPPLPTANMRGSQQERQVTAVAAKARQAMWAHFANNSRDGHAHTCLHRLYRGGAHAPTVA